MSTCKFRLRFPGSGIPPSLAVLDVEVDTSEGAAQPWYTELQGIAAAHAGRINPSAGPPPAPSAIRFIARGRQIQPNMTVEANGIADRDSLHVVITQPPAPTPPPTSTTRETQQQAIRNITRRGPPRATAPARTAEPARQMSFTQAALRIIDQQVAEMIHGATVTTLSLRRRRGAKKEVWTEAPSARGAHVVPMTPNAERPCTGMEMAARLGWLSAARHETETERGSRLRGGPFEYIPEGEELPEARRLTEDAAPVASDDPLAPWPESAAARRRRVRLSNDPAYQDVMAEIQSNMWSRAWWMRWSKHDSVTFIVSLLLGPLMIAFVLASTGGCEYRPCGTPATDTATAPGPAVAPVDTTGPALGEVGIEAAPAPQAAEVRPEVRPDDEFYVTPRTSQVIHLGMLCNFLTATYSLATYTAPVFA